MKSLIQSSLVVTFLCLLTANTMAAEKLSDLLHQSKWEGIIGTWVDANSMGSAVKTTYAWKIEDRVIEVTTKQKDKEDVGLIGVNAKTDEVFFMGASSDGTSSLGKWEIDGNGDAVLGVLFTTGEGEQGGLSIRHHLEDKDTMTVTIELPDPIEFKMVRAE